MQAMTRRLGGGQGGGGQARDLGRKGGVVARYLRNRSTIPVACDRWERPWLLLRIANGLLFFL